MAAPPGEREVTDERSELVRMDTQLIIEAADGCPGPGTKDDTVSCREFYQDMRRRGLKDPLLAVTDGHLN